MNHLPNPELDALTRDLEALFSGGGPEPAEVTEAREAIRRAAQEDGTERALTLARMALDRARRAIGVAVDPRPSWRDALRASPRADAPREDHARPLLAGRHYEVELDSEIPDAHPEKSEIEASVAGAFVGVKGHWRVAILVQPNARWWGIRVEGASICWTGTLEGAEEQSPEFLAGRVREAVQLGVMQAALPRPRARADRKGKG